MAGNRLTRRNFLQLLGGTIYLPLFMVSFVWYLDAGERLDNGLVFL